MWAAPTKAEGVLGGLLTQQSLAGGMEESAFCHYIKIKLRPLLETEKWNKLRTEIWHINYLNYRH